MSPSSDIDQLVGREIVLDVASRFVFVGRLTSYDEQHFVLLDADVHDLRDTATTREVYVLDSKRHGVRANRKRVIVRREDVVSFSALDDVLE
jgi:small nuclear ribonucleoprotein (snRNP)-like protein